MQGMQSIREEHGAWRSGRRAGAGRSCVAGVTGLAAGRRVAG